MNLNFKGVSVICGQTGVCGSVTVGSEKAFQRLLIYNSVRGIDSTGAASVKRPLNKKEIEIVVAKELGHPFNLLGVRRQNEHDFTDVMAGTSRALLGHCRAATKGETSRFNAHPFCFQNVVGTHNGTLSWGSHDKLEGRKKFQTDSEAIFAEIEAFGIAATVKKFKGYKENDNYSCSDAYALVWYDTRDNTINFLRNKERPLWFAFDKKHEQLFWSSERDHLVAGMADTAHDDVKWLYPLPENDHYSWIIPEYGKAFGKPRVVKREGDTSGNFTQGTTGQTNTKDYGIKSHGDSASRYAWCSGKHHFWERFVQSRGDYIYSQTENGTYYDTLQEAWDNLPDNEKLRRLDNKMLPNGVRSGYIWREEGRLYVKLEKPDLKLVHGSNSETKTYHDEVKEKKLREATLQDRKAYVIHKEQNKRVYWDTDNKRYVVYTFDGMYKDPPWSRSEVMTCPEFVPFTPLDTDANHRFKHIGKGKKKVVYFKGYKNEMLVRQTFEKIMSCGCVNCKRTPQWGNPVNFLNNTMFMCEHCARNDDQLKQWKDAVQQADDEGQMTLEVNTEVSNQ